MERREAGAEERTKIKLCGLSRRSDIEAANELSPEYIGFVFAPGSRRYVEPERAEELKRLLAPDIIAVGVFVNDSPGRIARLLDQGIIDMAQLHGQENESYIRRLKRMTQKPVVKAFCIESPEDAAAAEESSADLVLLDSGGGGTGETFNWSLIQNVRRPYFLAGGLTPGNAGEAVRRLRPYALDVSSGIETDGYKDREKMAAFVHAARKEERR